MKIRTKIGDEIMSITCSQCQKEIAFFICDSGSLMDNREFAKTMAKNNVMPMCPECIKSLLYLEKKEHVSFDEVKRD